MKNQYVLSDEASKLTIEASTVREAAEQWESTFVDWPSDLLTLAPEKSA